MKLSVCASLEFIQICRISRDFICDCIVVTPMMKTYFDYGDFENSILYLSGGGELILVFIALTLASKKCSDRAMILFGIILNIITYIWFISTVPFYAHGDRSNLWSFAIGTVLDLASIPILLDISLALFSKLISDEGNL